MSYFRGWITAAALMALAVLPAQAESEQEAIGRKAMSATLFVFFHELGHALIAELDLPAVGREEDVVDEFATYVLIELAKNDPTIFQILTDAVESWRLSHLRNKRQGWEAPYWDEHGLDLQRYYNIVCLMYGADKTRWNKLRLDAGIPPERAERCVREYPKKARAWERLIDPHVLPQGADSSNVGRLLVAYGDTKTASGVRLRAAMQQSQFFETVAATMNGLFKLPRNIDVIASDCGMENAFWDPMRRRIVMCYELISDFYNLYGGEVQVASVPTPATAPEATTLPPVTGPETVGTPIATGPVTGPETVGGPIATPTIAFRIVGHWKGETKDRWGNKVILQLILDEDGTFAQRTENGTMGLTVDTWGKAQIGTDVLRLDVEGFKPLNFCGSNGCEAIQVSDLTVPYRVVDPNAIETPDGILRRSK